MPFNPRTQKAEAGLSAPELYANLVYASVQKYILRPGLLGKNHSKKQKDRSQSPHLFVCLFVYAKILAKC